MSCPGSALGVPDAALQRRFHLVPGLPGGLRVRGDRGLHGGCGGHGEPVVLLLRPGGAFELDQFVGEFDCHRRIV